MDRLARFTARVLAGRNAEGERMAIDERIRGLGYDRAADQRAGGRDDNRLEYSGAAALQPPAPPESHVQQHITGLRQRVAHNDRLFSALIQVLRPMLDESDTPEVARTTRPDLPIMPSVQCPVSMQLMEIHTLLQQQTAALELVLSRVRV